MTLTLNLDGFPDFSLDGIDLADLPQGWSDSSWRQDTSPSLINESLGIRLWIADLVPDERVTPESKRFILCRNDDMATMLSEFDDWNDILEAALVVQEVEGSRPEKDTLLTQAAMALIEATFKAAIKEIDADTRLRACKSFSELDDMCDANCLGSACDDNYPLWLDVSYHDDQLGFTLLGSAVTNSWQNRIDRTLRGRAASPGLFGATV